MLSEADSTRVQLLDAAERLFLEKGLDDVSARAIVREAGQKNQSALQYHFGGRSGLISAIISRRMKQVEARRRKLIAATIPPGETPDLHTICRVLVGAPFYLCRETREFREFLGQLGQKLLASDQEVTQEDDGELASLRELRIGIRKQLSHIPAEVMSLRAENANNFVLLTISRRARLGGSFRGRRADLFYNNLVDQLTGMLSAPVSEETQSVLD